MSTYTFTDTDISDTDMDSTPDTENIIAPEYPCESCGKEAGPYGGRGPKPKKCADCKPASRRNTSRSPRVTGSTANLAAQAAGVLTQLNGMIAIGAMALGLNKTAMAMGSCQENFEQQAYQALLTDQELCKLILKGGVKSAKFSLGIAYAGMGTVVVPTAVNEIREKREARRAEMEDMA